MTTPIEYVLQLKARLVTSPIVASFAVVEQKVWPDRGYIRIRMALINGDFLEAAVLFHAKFTPVLRQFHARIDQMMVYFRCQVRSNPREEMLTNP